MTRLLLDTHALVWLARDLGRVPPGLIDQINGADDVFVSAISLWEIVIKDVGRQPMVGAPDAQRWFAEAMASTGFSLLAIELSHIAAIQHLPMHHRDPFDRLLVAQASVEGLTLVSRDRQLGLYDVSVIWDDE